VKFLLYNLFGGLIMLAAVIGLYVVTRGTASAHSTSATSCRLLLRSLQRRPRCHQGALSGLHVRLRHQARYGLPRCCPMPASSHAATAVLITAVMDKIGTFGMLRYCLQLFPSAATYSVP